MALFSVNCQRIVITRASLVARLGNESACHAGDPGSIPRSGRSTEEGIGYPFQYSWASLVAHMVKSLPEMQKTWVWSLDLEDPLEKGMATHSSILAWKIPWTVWLMGLQRVKHDWATFPFTLLLVRDGLPLLFPTHILRCFMWVCSASDPSLWRPLEPLATETQLRETEFPFLYLLI